MRRTFLIGVLSALAAALCVSQAAHATTVGFDDISIAPASYGGYTNDLYDGGLHFMDDSFAVMPVGLNQHPTGQASQFMEAGNYLQVEPLTLTAYTGPIAPNGSTNDIAFSLWFLKIGLGDGNTGLTDMVTISGTSSASCTMACNPTMTVAVTSHFQLLTLDGFTDLTKVTINQQLIGNSDVIDSGWLGFDDFSYTPYVAGADNPRPDPPSPVPAGNVPEPSAWALMIVGFGGVGALLRRRRPAGFATA